jgi:hypothetical protein
MEQCGDYCYPEPPTFDGAAAFFDSMGLGLTMTQEAFDMFQFIDPMSPDFETQKTDFLTAIGAQ